MYVLFNIGYLLEKKNYSVVFVDEGLGWMTCWRMKGQRI